MFDGWYAFRYVNSQTVLNEYPLIRKFTYSFKTKSHRRYLVLIHEYEYKVFVIKSHDAAHKLLSNRYNLIFNDFDCAKVFRTVIEIALQVLKTERIASFAFVGVPKENKEEKDQANSQRLRVYKLIAENFLGVETFLHGHEIRSNCYLLVNKYNIVPEAMYETIVDMFAAEFEELSHL